MSFLDMQEEEGRGCPYGVNSFVCRTMPHENARSICPNNCDHEGSCYRSNPIVLDGKLRTNPSFVGNPLSEDRIPDMLVGTEGSESEAYKLLSDDWIASLEHYNRAALVS